MIVFLREKQLLLVVSNKRGKNVQIKFSHFGQERLQTGIVVKKTPRVKLEKEVDDDTSHIASYLPLNKRNS